MMIATAALLAVTAALAAFLVTSDGAARPDDARVRMELRQGGVVVVLRHAVADTAAAGCAGQANLTDQGHAVALAIKSAFQRVDARVESVLVSPLCRTQETARLAFPETTANIRDDLAATSTEGDVAWRRQIHEVQELLLGRRLRSGVIRVLVTHSDVISAATGVDVAQGEALILRPRGQGRFIVLDRIAPDDWTDLARSADRSLADLRRASTQSLVSRPVIQGKRSTGRREFDPRVGP